MLQQGTASCTSNAGAAPCREESGSCYALDIGGTNFRVVYYKLSDKHGVVVSDTQQPCVNHSNHHKQQQQQPALYWEGMSAAGGMCLRALQWEGALLLAAHLFVCEKSVLKLMLMWASVITHCV